MADLNERNLPIPPELTRLSAFIDSNIECLASPSSELRAIALHAAKHTFDWGLGTEESSKPHLGTLLATLTQATPPQTRSQARTTATQQCSQSSVQRRQKKIDIGETPLPSLFIEGMNIEQIWQQLDLRIARICQNLEILQGDGDNENEDSESENGQSEGEDDDDDESDFREMDIDNEECLSDEEGGSSSAVEGAISLEEESSEDDHELPPSMLDIACSQQKLKPFSQQRFGLDDGFFDLASFNAETSELEAREVSKRKLASATDESSAEESDEIDLFGLVDDSETEVPTELYYNDFFEGPARGRTENRGIKPSKVRFHGRVSVKKIKPVGRGMPVSSMGDEDSDEDDDNEDSD